MTEAPLRVLLWHWGRRGGGPRYTMELARALARRPGIDLHLSLSRQSELFTQTNAVGVPTWHVDTYQGAASFVVRSTLLPFFGTQLASYLKRHRIQVVYNTMDFLWGSVLAPAVSAGGSLYLLAVHDAERHPGENGAWRRWLLARDIRHADGAITMTEAVRERLIAVHNFPSERAWTAPLGVFVDTPSFAPRVLPQDRSIRLLFFGRILPYKGLDIMLQAMPIIRSVRPDVGLEIWTSGDLNPYRPALERTDGIKVHHGWIAEDQIPGVFARTDICVLPYREASQSAVVATAMAAGMPIVTTPIPGLVEQIAGGAAGRIADDLSPESFAHAVLGLVADRDGYAALSAKAVQLSSESLGWGSIAERIEGAARSLSRLGTKAH